MDVLYAGFDGLDLALKLTISKDLDAFLSAKKDEAAETRQDAYTEWQGQSFKVAVSGGVGGYAYRLDTGLDGEVWFLKSPNIKDPWGARVSAKSAALLCHGLSGWQCRIEKTARLFGADLTPDMVSIGRVDVAVDILAPEFVLSDEAFVMHARMSRKTIKDVTQINGRSGRTTSVTIGKMPGRQVILYDKREEVLAKGKGEWLIAWNKSRAERGQLPIDILDAATSRVWRVEARAGKDHLRDHWNVRTWGDLHCVLPHILSGIMEDIRYCRPSDDGNRARWPTHYIWQLAQEALQACIVDSQPLLSPTSVRIIYHDQKVDILARQALGLVIGLAVLDGQTAETFEQSVEEVGRKLVTLSKEQKTPMSDRYAKTAERHAGLI